MADEALDTMLGALNRHDQSVCIICGGSLAESTSAFLCSDTCRTEWVEVFRNALAEAKARSAAPRESEE